MPPLRNLPDPPDDPLLTAFELPRAWIEPAIRACRLFNTAVDALFYDVPRLQAALRRGDAIAAPGEKCPSRITRFDALADPEGSLLLIDAKRPTFVHRYDSVEKYIESPHPEAHQVRVASITGVGSSALGSAALAWDISRALGEPVLAIVPGYGVADMVLQGLGGWFGFGMFDAFNAKGAAQSALASIAPDAASIGRRLAGSVPEAPTLRGSPVFRRGSGSSDVLHALLSRPDAQALQLLVGHSKGALQIGNALLSLAPDCTEGLHVVTLGCPIAPSITNVAYHQYLGLFDALGQLNAWGHRPDEWTATTHTTNPWLPPALDAGACARADAPA